MYKKYALCVGINDYPGLDADLRGCVNDARDWEDLLVNHGYTVFTLLDAAANKYNIITELRRLVDTAGWADRIVFTYSGHGTWLPDTDGDEADARDEALVCHDHQLGGLLTDDELQAIFGDLSYGTGALIVSDSCHSGTMTRGLADTHVVDRHPRFLSPALLLEDMTEERAVAMERLPASTPRRTASLISGCTDLEYSYDAEFKGRPNGAFTYAALQAYEPGINLAAWYARIRGWLPSDSYPQTPQLTASAYRRNVRAL